MAYAGPCKFLIVWEGEAQLARRGRRRSPARPPREKEKPSSPEGEVKVRYAAALTSPAAPMPSSTPADVNTKPSLTAVVEKLPLRLGGDAEASAPFIALTNFDSRKVSSQPSRASRGDPKRPHILTSRAGTAEGEIVVEADKALDLFLAIAAATALCRVLVATGDAEHRAQNWSTDTKPPFPPRTTRQLKIAIVVIIAVAVYEGAPRRQVVVATTQREVRWRRGPPVPLNHVPLAACGRCQSLHSETGHERLRSRNQRTLPLHDKRTPLCEYRKPYTSTVSFSNSSSNHSTSEEHTT
jgi:hypothetical protein